MDTIRDLRLAVLIDADNVAYTHIKAMLEEIAKYGTPTFKRIYADWTKPTVAGWKSVLLENSITPVQQYSYTSGKNATDSAMIIDAMDILYTGRVDGFCIVSSDSDFTRLASRLREAGMKVFGLGEMKTPTPFISACDKFIYIEILKKPEKSERKEEETPAKPKRRSGKVSKPAPVPEAPRQAPTFGTVNKELIKLIADSINDLADEEGWAYLGEVGNLLIKKQPNFDPRVYGFKKLAALIKSVDRFEIDERNTGNSDHTLVYVRAK